MTNCDLTSIGDCGTTASDEDFSNLTDIAGEESVLIISGPSAYDLAVANGFKGTVDEWLASLSAKIDSTTPTPTDKNPDALLGKVVDYALNSQQLGTNGTIDSARVTDPLSNDTAALADLFAELYKDRLGYLKNNTDNIIAGDMLTFSGNKDGVDLSFGFSTIRDPISGNLYSAIYDKYGDSLYYITPDRIVLSAGNGTPGTGTNLNAIVLTGLPAPSGANAATQDGITNELRFDDTNGIIWRKLSGKWISFYATDAAPITISDIGTDFLKADSDYTITGAYTFTGVVSVPTVLADDNSKAPANTAWVNSQGFSKIQSVQVSPDTITVDNGTPCSVENVGTPTAPVLKFTLSKGPAGPIGVSVSSITVNPDMTFTFTMTDGTTKTSTSGIYKDSNNFLIAPDKIGELPTDLVLNGVIYTAPDSYVTGAETLPEGLYLNGNIVMTDGTVYYPNTQNNGGILQAAS